MSKICNIILIVLWTILLHFCVESYGFMVPPQTTKDEGETPVTSWQTKASSRNAHHDKVKMEATILNRPQLVEYEEDTNGEIYIMMMLENRY